MIQPKPTRAMPSAARASSRYGHGITLTTLHGPFSADFRLVYLDGEESAPISCTKAQAEVFRALWEFAGQDHRAEDVMRRTGRSSPKPIDLFKSNKERLRAYKTLVKTNQKEGLYRMPCAAR
ncbi:hypothetical protein OS187_07320 [Xanthomonadaceae bacterium JHOS43]|nr:hypothetical protein [Xanthomonadaceae bacterium JHOS43]